MTDHQATEEINISSRQTFNRRLRTKARSLWPCLLNYPIPLSKGYAVLTVVMLVVFGLLIGTVKYVEGRFVAATFQAQDMEEAYNDLRDFYYSWGWLRSAR